MKQMLVKGFAIATLALGAWAQSVNTIVPSSPTVLLEPFGVAVDDHKNIYISDGPTHSIYRFFISTGELSLYTGSPGEAGAVNGTLKQAHFSDPKDILFARNGLVVADEQNRVIRFINLTSGQVSTLAGAMGQSGTADGPAADARFRLPRGLASDGDGNIYISDFRAGSIRKLDTNNIVTTLATGLNGPSGLSVANNGNIYIAERTAHRIALLDTNGVVSVLAGTGDPGSDNAVDATEASFYFPEDVIWLGSEFGLIVSDSGNHALRRVFLNADLGTFSVETYAGITETPGLKDGDRKSAQFNSPAGLASYSTGFIIVDQGNQAVRQILTRSTPPQIKDPRIGWVEIVPDADTGSFTAILRPVVDSTFNNDVTIAILGDLDAQNHFTSGPAKTNIFAPDPVPNPTESDPTAPLFVDHSPPSDVPSSIPSFPSPFQSLTIKAISTGQDPSEGRTPSHVVEATFRFRVATPGLNTSKIPGAVVFECATTNAVIWYTLDESEPTNSPNSTSIGPVLDGDSIALVLQKDVTIKARAFRENYAPSGTAHSEFSAADTVPNRISFGFDQGEASSDFVASPGQRFYAPVTLSLLPHTKMYGLQFNLSLKPGSAADPSANYALGFQSTLLQPMNVRLIKSTTNQSGLFDLGNTYEPIPPATFKGYNTTIVTITNVTSSGTNIISFPRTDPFFDNLVDLVFTNTGEHLLGVGWVERVGGNFLYPALNQDLITYSMAHDTLFLSSAGRVVPGIFSFSVPVSAQTSEAYTIKIGRPSATADGVSQDIFIKTPYLDDTNSPVKAIQTITITNDTNRRYIVGDIAPFRWFNAGEFGDGNMLNNDMTQLEEAIAYTVNVPPAGSDLFDAMDTCCISTNHVDLSTSFDPSNGDDTIINQIGYGDGKLDIADLFVAFRRSLDPSLVWYARYWNNGVRQAMVTNNTFRGETGLAASPKKGLSTRSVGAGDVPPSFSLSLVGVEALPGQMAELPVMAEVTGDFAVRAFMFNATVTTLDGEISIDQNIHFVPSNQLGSPSYQQESPAKFGGAWLDTSRVSVVGKSQIGVLQIKVPTNATIAAIYQIHLENVSASPNGISLFPVTTRDAYIAMKNRAPMAWTDEITDDWRVQYFGSTLNAQSAPAADPDGDGLSNLAEFRAGTSPIDANDALKLQVVISSTSGVNLRWSSVSGKHYVIETCGDLGSNAAWSPLGDPVDGTGQILESAHSLDAAHQFYRVRLAQ